MQPWKRVYFSGAHAGDLVIRAFWKKVLRLEPREPFSSIRL